jgi:hypothetical protein
MNYNEIWTREKFLEYRKLKRFGYTDNMLIEHFGEDIWESGLYNKNYSKYSFLKNFNEIKINPIKSPYKYYNRGNDFIENKVDHICEFISNEVPYVIIFLYLEINNIETYNIIFTTKEQYEKYLNKIEHFRNNQQFDIDELKNILEEQIDSRNIFSLFKRLSYIIFDYYKNHLKDIKLSIGDTNDKKKINFYRDIIKNSFENIKEEIEEVYNEIYYIYTIK